MIHALWNENAHFPVNSMQRALAVAVALMCASGAANAAANDAAASVGSLTVAASPPAKSASAESPSAPAEKAPAPLPAPAAAPAATPATATASAADPGEKSSPSTAQTTTPGASPPDYGIVCQYVLTSSYFKWLNTQKPNSDPTNCPAVLANHDPTVDQDANVLNGPGDLMVVVSLSGYEDALKRSGNTAQLRLFLNGFDLGSDGLIASAQRVGDRVALRFRVPNKKDSQAFWTTIFMERGIIEKVPLDASVGWSGNPAFIRHGGQRVDDLQVSVTSSFSLVWAGSLAFLLIWFFSWALVGSDTFRVAPTYPWWSDARSLQTKLHRATVPIWLWPFQRRKTVKVSLSDTKIEEILTGYFPAFTADSKDAYLAVAQRAINGIAPTADTMKQAVVGLALKSDWGKFRLPFSLAKVQWGGWMMFATTAAVFLWLVYARFPVLDGSVLGLVAVSTLTAGASLIIDNTSSKKNTSYSQGFFYDIMTDDNGVQQAHRYQAIVVNILLFAVGLLYVWQHLAYPTFDQSWLGLLGISGLAQVAGKGTLETKQDDDKKDPPKKPPKDPLVEPPKDPG